MENVEHSQAKRLQNTVDWLEQTFQQGRLQVVQLQQQLEQALSLLRAQGERLEALDKVSRLGNSQMTRLPRMEEELHQVRDRLEQFAEGQSKQVEQNEQQVRLWQADNERQRKALADMEQRISNLTKDFDAISGRLRALDEGGKRQQENVQQLVQASHDLRSRDDALEARILGGAEQTRRTELEVARFGQEFQALQKKDEIIEGRVQVLADLIKHLEEQQAAVLAEEAAHKELAGRVEVQRMEQLRLVAQNAELSQRSRENTELLASHARLLSQMELRTQNTDEQMAQLKKWVEDFREQATALLNNLARMDEEQRRRQIMELEQQIREIREHAVRSFGNSPGGHPGKIS